MDLRASFFLILSIGLLPVKGAVIPEAVKTHLQARVNAGVHPGIVIGVADLEGRTFAAAGRVKLGGESPAVSQQTVFELGSISKTFTALLYQVAVDGQLVKPSDPVSDFLPAGRSIPDPASAITLEELATHQSGLPRMPDNFKPSNPRNPYADYTQEQFFDWLAGVKIGSKKFLYSNAGMGWLGQILADRAGADYESLVKKWITGPCGLPEIGVRLTSAQKARAATPHRDGASIPMWDIPTLAGAGALRGTAEDVLRWSALHAGLAPSPLEGAMERVQKPRASMGNGGGKVALGWMILPTRSGNIVWHNGGTGGTRSWTGFNRKKQRAVVVLANSSESVDDIGLHLLDEDFPLKKPRVAVRLPKAALEKCAGVYSFGRDELHITVIDGNLGVQLTGQGVNAAYPESENQFFLRVVDAQLTFEAGEDGRMKAVVLHQNGQDQRALRKVTKAPEARN